MDKMLKLIKQCTPLSEEGTENEAGKSCVPGENTLLISISKY